MKKNSYKKLVEIIILLLCMLIIEILYGMFNNIKAKKEIEHIENKIEKTDIQNEIMTEENTDLLDFAEEIDGRKVIGTIEIEKIDYKGIVYENTELSTLKYGVGHFTSRPYINGNVCLAAHNTDQFWARLKELSTGDKILYKTFWGNKSYEVFNSSIIDETDFSLLENSNQNIITLITCVKNNKPKRLCVQAKEIL